MKILITGAAGFIGFNLCKSLMNLKSYELIGIDNINDYYDSELKYDRLIELGIAPKKASSFNTLSSSSLNNKFKFVRVSLEDKTSLVKIFKDFQFDIVCNLGAQAGVRYSITNPDTYVNSNIIGFLNILECCKDFKVKHLIYASSSSIYGLNKEIPFSTSSTTDKPISLYAASKKSNELMAHTYSYLFKLKTTGLRFFTVYGPWGRPDMAMFLFVDAIIKGKPIKVFNNGDMERDFTYIDDIVEGIKLVIDKKTKNSLYKIYNIGRGKSIKLNHFIEVIEKRLGKKANKQLLELQPGDVLKTWADTSSFRKDYGFEAKTGVESGVTSFIEWYKKYYKQE
ncbi:MULTISPECIES: NAD-dependent epimerase/dehydratase family protein [Croceitalea]|uniref:NAD-dependent epimerase/dehydratase family protein n=1 Tax=Croceitalea vernalis TaxID=3075599 RepID=A0ABU3BGJ3_9FLAO|nr:MULTISPECIES: NAD-dependent epimerase/dehydratase family protein [unclassified Croceitalea]MDT0539466.1 NAD-dependent epimerase/dehydratase family protein [Croceitalea sp. P059]MDT0621258.1 NAD-dependent epimerase/dehydratase family protein [Croceitalea sp. P007]